MVNPLSDEIIKQIAESKTGRTYPHEGKAMALEILEWRKRAKEAAAAALKAPTVASGSPWLGPGGTPLQAPPTRSAPIGLDPDLDTIDFI